MVCGWCARRSVPDLAQSARDSAALDALLRNISASATPWTRAQRIAKLRPLLAYSSLVIERWHRAAQYCTRLLRLRLRFHRTGSHLKQLRIKQALLWVERRGGRLRHLTAAARQAQEHALTLNGLQ
jgi:hypothetical protein